MSNMTTPKFWRMQLHPNQPQRASFYSAQSLTAGFIGLDFEHDVGDMQRVTQRSLPPQQRDYWAFAHNMSIGDRVLIISHHFPFALATVAGDYNYVREPVPELGVLFRHFRRVEDVRYYSDFFTNAAAWQQFKMTDTISPLHDSASASYKLIESWL
jgi:hypothetical protein